MYDQIVADPSRYKSRLLVLFLDKDVHHLSFESCAHLFGGHLDLRKQSVEPFMYYVIRYLVFHLCGRCACALGIYECECAVKADFSYKRKSIREVFLCLTRESDNNIGREGDVRHSFT